jgi:hypothetical protein|tara:strand:+ start:450 stop:797 length:348 start_codon:yes stop_codon:yes gene_type:complete
MEQKVTLNNKVFVKGQYEQVIDTSFTQLVDPVEVNPEDLLPSIEEFFEDYNALFFQIPKTGDNSHETLIVQSSEYINFTPFSEEITALSEEITSLRQQLLDTRQQLADLANGESN